jgi:hypothetical protein
VGQNTTLYGIRGQEETPSSIPLEHLKGKPKDRKGFARFMDTRRMEKNNKFKFF